MLVELNNATKKLCVIGDPVLHSKSPLIQNTMLQALGLDYIYLCQPVKAGEAEHWLACAKLATPASTPPCPTRRISFPSWTSWTRTPGSMAR